MVPNATLICFPTPAGLAFRTCSPDPTNEVLRPTGHPDPPPPSGSSVARRAPVPPGARSLLDPMPATALGRSTTLPPNHLRPNALGLAHQPIHRHDPVGTPPTRFPPAFIEAGAVLARASGPRFLEHEPSTKATIQSLRHIVSEAIPPSPLPSRPQASKYWLTQSIVNSTHLRRGRTHETATLPVPPQPQCKLPPPTPIP